MSIGVRGWRRRVSGVAVAGALVAGLASCAGGAPQPTTSPSPEPMFSSDEEAYEAALDSYRNYLNVYASIGADGGDRSDRILGVAGTEHANELLEEFRSMKDAGVHTTGDTELISAQLLEVDETRERIELQICLGVGTSRVLDSAGNDVTSERDPVVPLLVTFDSHSSDSIVITGSVRWSGDSFC